MEKDPIQIVYDRLNEDGMHEARHHTSPPRRFRASEAANCVRQIYHRHRGDRPAPRDAAGYIYGINGDIDHDVTRQLMNHHGITVGGVTFSEEGEATEHLFQRQDIEVIHNGEPVTVQVTCRADGELETPRGPALLEIKGMGFYTYQWLNKAFCKDGHEGALQRVRDKHIKYLWQCQVSMALTGHKLCYLLVKDRSTGTLGLHNDIGERSGIYIEFDPELYEKILQRFAYVQRKLKEDEVPPAEFAQGSNECKFCPFNYLCHGAVKRREKGLEPYVLYPGPQFEEHVENES